MALIRGKITCTLGYPVSVQLWNLAGTTLLYEITSDATGNYTKTVAGPAQYLPKRKGDGVVCCPNPMSVSASGGIININAQ
jgi:hypothetical protein